MFLQSTLNLLKKHHPRSKHNQPYDFEKLIISVPELRTYLVTNPVGETTLQFADSEAVKLLNKALLLTEYGITFWDIPDGQLCPPIPGRVDYVHYLADLFQEDKSDKHILDIGTGANLIYPLLGTSVYHWSFVGTDVSKESLENAQLIIDKNHGLVGKITLRLQPKTLHILKNVIQEKDYFDAVMCNPPFFKSEEEALSQNQRKRQNLGQENSRITHNFGGQSNELWFPGGELRFIQLMIKESVLYKNQVNWFTCLVSNKDNLYPLHKLLKKVDAIQIEVVKMQQGNKQSRFLAWRF